MSCAIIVMASDDDPDMDRRPSHSDQDRQPRTSHRWMRLDANATRPIAAPRGLPATRRLPATCQRWLGRKMTSVLPKWLKRVVTDLGGRDPLGLSRTALLLTDNCCRASSSTRIAPVLLVVQLDPVAHRERVPGPPEINAGVEVVRPGLVGPEADEVVPPAGEAVQVALEVEASGALGVVDQVVPVVRAGEDDGAAFGVLEEVGVVGMDAEGRHRGEGSMAFRRQPPPRCPLGASFSAS